MPLCDFITYLLRHKPTRKDAGDEARRLGIRLDFARYYFETLAR
jgi:hypothetical protein